MVAFKRCGAVWGEVMIKGSCKTCKGPERNCKPSHMAHICKICGIGIMPHEVETIETIGCQSYQYDGKGLTDLERRNYK
jgi:hypothetical protein